MGGVPFGTETDSGSCSVVVGTGGKGFACTDVNGQWVSIAVIYSQILDSVLPPVNVQKLEGIFVY